MLTNCSQTFLRVNTQKATRSQELPSCPNTSVFSVFTHLGTNPETPLRHRGAQRIHAASNLPKKKGIVGDKMKRISVVFAKHIKPHTRAPNLGIVIDLRNKGLEMRRGDIVHEIEPALCRNTLVTGTRVTSKKKSDPKFLDRQLACATREPASHPQRRQPLRASLGCDSNARPHHVQRCRIERLRLLRCTFVFFFLRRCAVPSGGIAPIMFKKMISVTRANGS